MNIESLADQVYGLDILTATTGQLAAASSGLTDMASRKQMENFEMFNNMMVSLPYQRNTYRHITKIRQNVAPRFIKLFLVEKSGGFSFAAEKC